MSRGFIAMGKCLLAAGLVLAFAPLDGAEASRFTVLHSFSGGDGAYPIGGLHVDDAGNLFGVTSSGGAHNAGAVFEVAPDGTTTVLYDFTAGSDGSSPWGRLIADGTGNLYGTTSAGGAGSCGTVFKLPPGGSPAVLHTFAGGSDGCHGYAGLIADNAGDLYGTTSSGGTYDGGTAFKLKPDGTEIVLHSFGNGSDGHTIFGGLIRDKHGNLYGSTQFGGSGCGSNGCGIVFELAPNGTETILHTFSGYPVDGNFAQTGLVADRKGNLYGTTVLGGAHDCGTVFELPAGGVATMLYSFGCKSDGIAPLGPLFTDNRHNLYGSTAQGGEGCRSLGCGTLFKLAPDGTKTTMMVMHSAIGVAPDSGMIADGSGNLYGTTVNGGGSKNCVEGCGVVFKLAR